jgi:ubiquitin-like modifier-activating enzyme ATG7
MVGEPIQNNFILCILQAFETGMTIPKSVGWEKNAAGKLAPRLADLAPMMDPKRYRFIAAKD